MAEQNNVGKCVDFTIQRNQGAELVQINEQGWKITGIFANALAIGDDRYTVRSDFGNGQETEILFPANITNMYDCPDMNVEMQGGRKRRRGKNKARKTRKARKASKRTRKH